jgi:DNA-binding XRE family transcriptional regulator
MQQHRVRPSRFLPTTFDDREHSHMIQKDQELSVTAGQLRAARALLGISQEELARKAGLSIPTIKRCESDNERRPTVSSQAQNKIRMALQAAGIEFIAENGGGAGVRLSGRLKQ